LADQDTEILLGDIKDQQSMDAIARRTRVIIAMAGPYAIMGEAVVAACIKEGTHYVDLTGGQGCADGDTGNPVCAPSCAGMQVHASL